MWPFTKNINKILRIEIKRLNSTYSWGLFESEILDCLKTTLIVTQFKTTNDSADIELFIGTQEDLRRSKRIESEINKKIGIDSENHYFNVHAIKYRDANSMDRKIYKAVVKDRGFA